MRGEFWLRRLVPSSHLSSHPAPTLPSPRVVFHVASLGELGGAIPIIAALSRRDFPGTIVLSVGTETGYQRAVQFASSHRTTHLYPLPAPMVEYLPATMTFLRTIQPHLFVSFEAEYLPLLFASLHTRRIHTILVNGRVSKRSLRAYRLFRPFFRPIFGNFARLGMTSETYRERAISLGADPNKTFVTGSSKYDGILERRQAACPQRWQHLTENRWPVLVAGSLRGRECRWIPHIVKTLVKDFPRLLAILAPRHLHRVGEIERELGQLGLENRRLSALAGNIVQPPTVIVVDSFGILFELYAIADVTFCGGTFEPIGGHNLLEPVVWGKRVCHGPFVHKLEGEVQVLHEHGAGITCPTPSKFAEVVRHLLSLSPSLTISQDTHERIFCTLSGASRTYASWILELSSFAARKGSHHEHLAP